MTKAQRFAMLFVASRLLESLYHANREMLEQTARVRFGTALTHVKWLNVDFEKLLKNEMNDNLDEDVENVYDFIDMLIKANAAGKEQEFIEHLKSFKP